MSFEKAPHFVIFDLQERFWEQCIFKYLRAEPEDHYFLLVSKIHYSCISCCFSCCFCLVGRIVWFTNATHHTDLNVCKNNYILLVTFLVSYVLITLSRELVLNVNSLVN